MTVTCVCSIFSWVSLEKHRLTFVPYFLFFVDCAAGVRCRRLFVPVWDTSTAMPLCKVVKLLGSLVPEEPRLARKLLEPLAKIIQARRADEGCVGVG